MGDYNPRFPQVLGEEWVPIRDEDITFSALIGDYEVGHKFYVRGSSVTPDNARFYIHDWPSDLAGDASTSVQPYMISIYGEGQEALAGPVESVIIPANSVGVTGASQSFNSVEALFRPNDTAAMFLEFDGTGTEAAVFFNMAPYNTLLNNKRILGVQLLYNAYYFEGDDPTGNEWLVYIRNDSATQSQFYASSATGALLAGVDTPPPVQAIGLGGVTPFWSTNTFTSTSASQQMPWTYGTLQKFDAGYGVTRISVRFLALANTVNTVNPPGLNIGYAALKVYYCEETREAVTAWIKGNTNMIMGAQILPTFRSPYFPHSTASALSPGAYLATLSSPTLLSQNASTSAVVNASRQLYSIPPHTGIQVNIPSPLSQSEGKVITSEEVDVLPQISLHDTSGPLTGVHVYGRQAIAQVYGTQEAQQEIYAGTAPHSQSYPYVRFYARRFGDTNIPLTVSSTSFPSSTVSIDPETFDALDEIIDGWRQVTLEFTTPPAMGATGVSPRWDLSATGEKAGSRWEVLGAVAPAISGQSGLLLNLVPSPNQLGIATYGAPTSGSQVNLTWIPQWGPYVSGMTDDQTADAALMFAVKPPTITGFSIIGASQAISGIGQDCGIDPCCIPTDIVYNEITWGLPVNTGYAYDFYERTEASSLGTADRGGAYTTGGGTAAFSVSSGHALIRPVAADSDVFATLANMGPDFDVSGRVGVSNEIATGSTAEAGLVGRYTNSSNYYLARITETTTGTLTFSILKNVAGSESTVASAVIYSPMNSGGFVNMRFMGFGRYLKAKVWNLVDPEPDTWDIETSDTSLTTGSAAGLFASNASVSGNSLQYDNLLITPPRYWFGYYELQRMDELDDWQTIMKCTNPGVTSFNDYEARVGIQSSYRIRNVDPLGFVGDWSSTISNTIPAPGVSGGCLEGGHVLIFTTNENQEGLYNLAYSNAWEGRVEENFTFPEAGFVQLQAMYDRDYFTAFRPTERGGEQFQREVLVQAAAIDPETLADFTSLRDMAWANVSYVCVRDEDGNRWLATVLVPTGRVVHFRKIYMATVNIIETTDTPSPVDPGWP